MRGIIKKRRGFTIVEILVIIVVIAMLTAIVTLAYSGLRSRAQVNIAQSDMRAVGQQAEVFRVQYKRSPISITDFSEILKNASVYDSTRTDAKSYAICADATGYAFVAWNPIVQGYKNGDTLYLYSYGGTQQIYELTNSSLSSNNQLDKICDQVYSTSTFDAWTYQLP
jgi:Tfp pilus assembly protein PilE